MMTMKNEIKSVKQWKIPLYKIYTDDEDIQLISKIIRRGSDWALGPEIEEFEQAIRDYVGTDYCVTLNSGTSALHATLLAYGLGKGDKIIIPSFSFISTANSILFVNANPVFSDIDETTLGLDPDLLQEKISPSVKAIMPMDYGGISCKIFDIKKFTYENTLIPIEDTAESLGSSVNGKKVGSISDSAIFSFCGNKVLTTGEGGAVVTNSKSIYEKIKLIRSHGRQDKINYFNNTQESTYLQLGYNWRMSSITAALGISQINKLDKIIKMRQANAKYISEKLSKHNEITIPNIPEGFIHIFQMYSIRLPNKKIRDKLQSFLEKKAIFSKVYFKPIHLTSFYQKLFRKKPITLPKTEMISEQILTLPLYPNMTKEEKEYLTSSISEFFEKQI